MDIFDHHILSFFRTLNEFGVEYILIGGFATNFHGYARATGDIDFWIHDTPANRDKFIAALKALNMEGMEALKDMHFLTGYCQIMLDNGFYADIIGMPKGMEALGFEPCYSAAIRADVNGIEIPFLEFNHLIESKKAAGRLKDKLDIEELERLHRKK